MTRAEKAELLQLIAHDLGDAFPGIDSTPGVAGGEPCIVRTRIPVWVLEQARRLGTNDADLLRSYPTLRALEVRGLGHDILTTQESGRAGRAEPDEAVLAFAHAEERALFFYQRCGFQVSNLGQHYPGIDRFICKRALA